MSSTFPKPTPQELIWEDRLMYAALARFPIAKGHVIVAWKKPVRDLHLLSRRDYEHLMDAVDDIRNAMLNALGVKKVYLLYMDEANHVHWHLVPRYGLQGVTAMRHRPAKLRNFSLAKKIRERLKQAR